MGDISSPQKVGNGMMILVNINWKTNEIMILIHNVG